MNSATIQIVENYQCQDIPLFLKIKNRKKREVQRKGQDTARKGKSIRDVTVNSLMKKLLIFKHCMLLSLLFWEALSMFQQDLNKRSK